MSIYDNKFMTYNNLMICFLIAYSGTAQLSVGILRIIATVITLVGWIVFYDKSKKEYYKLLDYVAKETR